MSETIKAEIAGRIDAFFEALDRQDMDALERLIPEDAEMVNIGTESGEYWVGWDGLRRDSEDWFESLQSYKASAREGRIHIGASGDAAWFAQKLDAVITSAQGEQRWEGARLTGVFEKRGGDWMFVQSHLSIPEDR